MNEAQWWQIRRYLDSELARIENPRVNSDYYEGQYVALLKIKGRFFLTDAEQADTERVRREMFG